MEEPAQDALLNWESVYRSEFRSTLQRLASLRSLVDTQTPKPPKSIDISLEKVEDELLEAYHVLENRVLPGLKLNSTESALEYSLIVQSLPRINLICNMLNYTLAGS